jgi:hypothetical protein
MEERQHFNRLSDSHRKTIDATDSTLREQTGMTLRRYYSVRAGLNGAGDRYDLSTLKALFLAVYYDFERRECFQELLGKDCVDGGSSTGLSGYNIDAFVLRKVRKANLWPLRSHIQDYTEDDVFDMMEFLYDYVAVGVLGHYHDYSDCGWHYNTFDRATGRFQFRETINELLTDYGHGFELSEEGEILRSPEAGFEQLMSAEVESSQAVNVKARVDHAILKYRGRSASLADRQEAVRQLADVLEFLRPELKKVLLTADEKDLFNIANNFGIRHHNQRQRTAFDSNIWTSWMFYIYLATIHAAIRQLAKKDPSVDA